MMPFLILYWKHIVVITAILATGYFVYHKIYTIGYEEASVVYKAQIKEYENKVDTKISNIEASANALVSLSTQNNLILNSDLKAIIKSVNGKQLYVIKDGKCSISDDFVRIYNEGVARANKK